MDKLTKQKGLLTIPEVAAELGLSYPTVKKLIEQKYILSVRLGTKDMVPRTLVEKILHLQ